MCGHLGHLSRRARPVEVLASVYAAGQSKTPSYIGEESKARVSRE
jgi:hypothetical protein